MTTMQHDDLDLGDARLLAEAMHEIRSLTKERDQLKATNADLSKHLEYARDRVEDAQALECHLVDVRLEANGLAGEHCRLEAANADLSKRLEAAELARVALEAQAERATKSLGIANRRLERAKANCLTSAADASEAKANLRNANELLGFYREGRSAPGSYRARLVRAKAESNRRTMKSEETPVRGDEDASDSEEV